MSEIIIKNYIVSTKKTTEYAFCKKCNIRLSPSIYTRSEECGRSYFYYCIGCDTRFCFDKQYPIERLMQINTIWDTNHVEMKAEIEYFRLIEKEPCITFIGGLSKNKLL